MHKLCIHHLGPIESCEIEISRFIVLTGEQASGKSTIAKAVYFFRTVKDEILSWIMKKRMGSQNTVARKADTATRAMTYKELFQNDSKDDLLNEELKSEIWFQRIEFMLLDKFIQISGLSWNCDTCMYLTYYYDENTWIRISGPEPGNEAAFNSVCMKFSKNVCEFLNKSKYSF